MPSAAGRRAGEAGRRAVVVEALHHVREDGGVALAGEDEVDPGAEHALQVVGIGRGDRRMHGAARRGLLEASPAVTGHAVHLLGHLGEREAGPDVDRVDVGPGRQERPHLREGQVLVQRVAARQNGRRAVEDLRDLEGQRAPDHVLLAQGVDDGIRRLPLVHGDHHLRSGWAQRVGLQLVPEHEGQDEDEQSPADAEQDPAPAAHPGRTGRPACAAALRLVRGGCRNGRRRVGRRVPAAATAGPLPNRNRAGASPSPSKGSMGPLMRCPARPAAAPWRPRCRRPCAPPSRSVPPPAASARPPPW